VAEYEERAGRYWRLRVVEVDAGASGGDDRREAVLQAETDRILARLPEEGEVVALTRAAKGMTSRGLSRYLSRRQLRSAPGITFVVGGAWGLGESILQRAHRRLSLSPMTLPHELARLILAEQLYRAGTIARGEPYHKGGAAG
jgi:23S rRNA (pseudouridine1915-N3)-methyltransferase